MSTPSSASGSAHGPEHLRARVAQLDSIVRVTGAIACASGLQAVLDEALKGLGEVLAVRRMAILLADPDGSMRVRAAVGLSERYLRRVEEQMPWTPAAVDPVPVVSPDVRLDESLVPHWAAFAEEGILALALFPLAADRQLLGAIVVHLDEPHEFTSGELQAGGAISTHVALSIVRRRAVEDRRLLLNREQMSRGAAESAERRSAYLAEATARLVSSLDYEATLTEVARLLVPALADWCVIDIRTESGAIEPLVMTHTDLAREHWTRELRNRYPPAADASRGVARVLATGEPEFHPDVPDDMLERSAQDADHLALLRTVGLRSIMVVPLQARGRTMGAVTLAMGDSGRRFTSADLALAHDLARHAALAVENARLYKQAQEANRAKDEFLATLSHELRTPLNAIMGWVHMLRSGVVGEEAAARALQSIERNSSALAQLIADLLDVSRGVTGKLTLECAPVDLGATIEAALDTVRPAATARGVELSTLIDRESCAVWGDGNRLRQVVWNLLSNAVKFTPQGGRVTVTLGRAGTQIEVTVADTGAGIEPAFLPYVFDRFRQGDGTITRRHGGLGLGLAIVRHLAELHGGSVSAESAGPGLGSTFTVRLPVPAVLTPAQEEPVRPPASNDRPLGSIRVLVVDDDDDARHLVDAVLEHAGAEVRTARSAADALPALSDFRPDVLVVDIAMPDENGLSLMARIRQLPASAGGRTPAAALTAYAGLAEKQEALSAGFQVYLAKPVAPQELVSAIANIARNAPV